MRRKTKILVFTGASIAVVCLILAAASAVVLRSGFERWLTDKAQNALGANFPLQAEIGSLNVDLLGGSIEAHEIRLSDRLQPGDSPDIYVRKALVNFSVRTLLSTGLHFDRVAVDGLDLRLRQDPETGLNLTRMFHRERSSSGGFSPVKLRMSRVDLSDARVSYEDQSVVFASSCDGFDLSLDLEPQRDAFKGHTRIEGFSLSINGHRIPVSRLETEFELGANRLSFSPAILGYEGVSARIEGAIEPLSRLQYFFRIEASCDLPAFHEPDLSAIFPSGVVQLSGSIAGEGPDFRLDGQIQSDSIQARFLPIEGIRGSVQVDRQGTAFSDVIFKTLGGGGSAEGHIAWTTEEDSRARVKVQGVRLGRFLEAVKVRPIPVSAWSGIQAELTWPGLEFAEISGDGVLDGKGRLTDGTEGSEPIPFGTSCRFRLGNRSFSFENGDLRTASTTARYQGRLDFNGDFSLGTEAAATDARELWAAGKLFDFPSQAVLATHPLQPNGRLTASLDLNVPAQGVVTLSADLDVDAVSYRGIALGKVAAALNLSEDRLEVYRLQIQHGFSTVSGRLGFGREPFRLADLQMGLRDIPLTKILEFNLFPATGDPDGLVSADFQADFPADSDMPVGKGLLRLRDGSLFGEALPSLEARLDLDGNKLTVKSGKANLLEGTVTFAGAVDLDSGDINVSAEGESLVIDRINALPDDFAVGGIAGFQLKATGSFDAPVAEASIQCPELTWKGESIRNVIIHTRWEEGQAPFSIGLTYIDQPIQISGNLGTETPFPVEAAVELNSIPLAGVISHFSPEPMEGVEGTATGQFRMRGDLTDLASIQVEGELTDLSISFRDRRLRLAMPSRASYKNYVLEILPTRMVGNNTDFEVAGKLEFQNTPQVNARIKGSLNLQPLEVFFGDASLQGELVLETAFAGNLRDPRIVGTAHLSNFLFSSPDIPIGLTEGRGDFRFTSSQLSIEQFSARTELGSIALSGGIFLEGLRPVRWQVNLSASGLSYEFPKDIVTVFDADLDLSKGDESQLLSGVVYIRSAEYLKDTTVADLIRRFSTIDTASPEEDATSPIRLDISVEAYQSIRIANNLGRVVGSAELNVNGTLDRPVVLGSLSVDEGKLTWDGKDFEIARGIVAFNDPGKTAPYLNFEVETRVREYDVSASIQGPIESIEVQFRSEPPLAPSSILALLASGQTSEEIFGNDPASRNRSDALMTYGAGTLLSKTLGKAVEAQANRLFGFDRFAVDPFIDDSRSKDPGARITLGKQLTRSVGITYVTNLTSDFKEQTVVIEYRINDWLTLIGTSQDDNTFAVDFRFRKRF